MIVTVYTLFLVILSVCGLNIFICGNMNIQWGVSVSDTIILKGIAILMVLIGHIGQAIPGARIFTPLTATGVGIFLLCSGYGIEKNYPRMEEGAIGTNG